jgi:prolyl oligopeptidase
MTIDSRPTLSAPDDDPYLWLEDIDEPKALAWVDARTAETLARFGTARFAADRDALAALWDRPDKIPYVSRRGAFAYNIWQDAANPRGLWRRTTWVAYRDGAPAWDVLLDVDALGKAEGENWVWAGSVTLPGTHDRAMVSLSRGGGDATMPREFDIPTKSFVADGFALPEGKSSVGWLDRDTLFVSSARGEGMATRSGYARTIRLWRRGTPFADAQIVFQIAPDSMTASGGLDRTVDPPRFIMTERTKFFEYDFWMGDTLQSLARLDVPADAEKDVHGDWLTIKPRLDWTVAGTTYPGDTLLGVRLSRFLAGARDFAVLFTPGERRALQGASWCGDKLIISVLDELRPVFELATPGDAGWTRSALPGLPTIGVVGVGPLDVNEEESNGEALVLLQDPLTPPSLLLADLAPETVAAPRLLRSRPADFDPTGLAVTRHEAVSIDGERVPYV